MKGIESLLMGAIIVLFASATPAALREARADSLFERMVPSETQEVDVSGAHWTPDKAPKEPWKIEQMVPSGTQEVDTTGAPWTSVKTLREPWNVERMVPSETQEAE